MGVIEWYALFALTTGIMALVTVFNPLLRKAQAAGIENPFTDNPLLTQVVYLVLSVISAPVLFLPLVVPSMNARFTATLEKEVLGH
jgi:hypothetical protein